MTLETITKAPFRFDQVGSLLRPKAIKEARADFAAGSITKEELTKIEDKEIRRIVGIQKEIGLHAITDGEFRRRWWHLDFLENLNGITKYSFYSKAFGRKFKKVIAYANSLNFKVMVDINPELFTSLNIAYDDLSFFHELGVWGLRLDEGFTGLEESKMTRNPYGLKIEINMSAGTKYVDRIMDYAPNEDNLLGCHNFYPQTYTGLGEQYFIDYSEMYRKYNLHTAAFVSSHEATFGPWPVNEGLPTIESDRNRPLASQVQHLLLTHVIDDVIIGNAYASEAELKEVADAFYAPYPFLHVDLVDDLTAIEKTIVLDWTHLYRNDASDYLLRSTLPRVKYSKENIEPHHLDSFKRGDIIVVNNDYSRYKGEMQIALTDFENDGRRNVVGHITASDLPLLDYLKPWSSFTLKQGK